MDKVENIFSWKENEKTNDYIHRINSLLHVSNFQSVVILETELKFLNEIKMIVCKSIQTANISLELLHNTAKILEDKLNKEAFKITNILPNTSRNDIRLYGYDFQIFISSLSDDKNLLFYLANFIAKLELDSVITRFKIKKALDKVIYYHWKSNN